MLLNEEGKPYDYLTLEVNAAWERLVGISREQAIGKTSSEIAPATEQDPFDWIGKYGKVALTGQSEEFEAYFKPFDKYYQVSTFSPKKGYFITIFFETTQSKKAEMTIRHSEERFRLVAEAANVLVYEIDSQKNRLKIYRGENVLGYTQSEIPLKLGWWYNQVHPDDIAATQLKTATAIETGKDELLEYRMKRKQGDYIVVHDTVKLVKDNQGNVVRLVGGLRDVTERKKAEEELKKNEQLYRTLFDNSRDGFALTKVIFDEKGKVCDGVILQVNQAFEKLKGIKTADIVGKRTKQVTPNVEPAWLECQEKVVKTGETTHVINHQKDTNRYYDVYMFAYSGDIVGELFRDITDQKNLEKRLQEKERLAAIGATAGMVGHDIRNPLQAMVGDVYLLKDYLTYIPESGTKREMTESLEGIEKNISYVNKIIADLQDYARPITPECMRVNLYDLVNSVFRLINLPGNIKVSIDFEQDFTIVSDPTLVRRILTNLIINAIQAMPNGGELTISGCPHFDNALIMVEDTGVGIPEDVKPKLFTPMITTKPKGQGFGLAVVKRLVESLGGTIGFESQVGVGTKFVVELPRC
jgi:PAS domain S-box-containing protein